jgi:hypothetical protein
VKRIEVEAEQWSEAERLVDRYLSRAGEDAVCEVYFRTAGGSKIGYRAGNDSGVFPHDERPVLRTPRRPRALVPSVDAPVPTPALSNAWKEDL